MTTYPKSPLRYPGGKSRAVKYVLPYLPKNTREVISPFLGGGSVELAMAAQGIKVHCSDSLQPLINFWNCLYDNPTRLRRTVERCYMDKTHLSLNNLRADCLSNPGEFVRAAAFYTLNRCTFSGTTLAGGLSKGMPRHTLQAVRHMGSVGAHPLMDNMTFWCKDYREVLDRQDYRLLYLDPPYKTESKLYGNKGGSHTSFNHEDLANRLLSRKGDCILHYNDCEWVRDRYQGWVIKSLNWKYGMSKDKNSNELLIMNYGD